MPTSSAYSTKLLLLNSAACYVLAFLLTTVLHECGHAIVGARLGSAPVLHHNYVAHLQRDTLPVMHQVYIAIAGPLVSLVQGVIAALLSARRAGGGAFRLFLLWMALLGFGNALGYLMTGPFFVAGDLGKAEVLLDLSMGTRAIIAVIGAAALALVAYRSTRPFLSFAPDARPLSDPQARMDLNRTLIIGPWLIGSIVMTILYLPVMAVVSIIYPVSSGMVFIFPWKHAKRITDASPLGSLSLGRPAWSLYAALLVAVLIFRLVLAPGIAIP